MTLKCQECSLLSWQPASSAAAAAVKDTTVAAPPVDEKKPSSTVTTSSSLLASCYVDIIVRILSGAHESGHAGICESNEFGIG